MTKIAFSKYLIFPEVGLLADLSFLCSSNKNLSAYNIRLPLLVAYWWQVNMTEFNAKLILKCLGWS